MWFGVCIAVAIELVPVEISSTAVSLYLFLINIIGGNLNLLLPALQKHLGLRNSMIILFPGAYFAAGIFFTLAGLSWKIRCVKPPPATAGSPVSDADETAGLIQAPQLVQQQQQTDLDRLLESQELRGNLSKRHAHINSETAGLQSPFSFTASI